jgi:regulator of replication initiation timing
MSSPNPPPPFDADAARRLALLTDFEQSHLWCNCEDFDPPERCGSCQAWDRIKADLHAAVAEVERLQKQIGPLQASHVICCETLIEEERLRQENDRLRERVKELEASVERVAGDDMASLNAGLSLPNLQVTRDLRDARDLT